MKGLRNFACWASIALFPVIASAQSFVAYNNDLQNWWQNYSWCATDMANTEYVYPGAANSIKATTTGGFQAFSLYQSPGVPARYVSALTFYINGGPTAGRTLGFQAITNTTTSKIQDLNKFIVGGQVPANHWSLVTIPVSEMGISENDSIVRFWFKDTTGGAQPAYWLDNISWTLVAAPARDPIDVVTNKEIRTVDPKHLGANTAIWDYELNSGTCENLIKQAGFKAFRFPGGSASDSYNWSTNTTGSNTWTWSTDFDQFAGMAAFTGGQDFITVNYGTSTATDAANWVNYSNVQKHYGFKYWELGNEVYGTWETDSHAKPNDPVTYAQQYALYYQAMKAQDPTIKVGAVVNPGEDSYINYPDEAVTNPVTGQTHSGWTPMMLSTLAGLGVTPDFVIYHRYPEYLQECDLTLFGTNSGWASDIADMRMQLNDYLGKIAGPKVQIMNTENNCDAGNPGKQLCSLVNALYMADSLGCILQTECNSYMFWDLINGQSDDGDQSPWLYGWRSYGDEGVMSPDFTQSYPTLYIEQILNDFAAPGDAVLPVTSSYPLLTTYATKRANGTVRVMAINLNPTKTIAASINLESYSPNSTATVYTYGIPQDNAAKNGLQQSVAISTISKVTTSTPMSFGPYSVTVVQFTPQK
jgi:alpha-N-arabinofuranosidase